MATRHYNDFVQGFLEYCADHEAPQAFKVWSALSIVAGALERKVWASNGFVTTYPNLYVYIIGDRGTGKSVMTNIAVRLLEEVPGIVMSANKINDASLVKKLMTVGQSKMFEYNGINYKNSSLYMYASEAADTFKEMYPGSSIITTLTSLYNCNDEPWTLKAKWKKDTVKDNEQAVYNPCINMLACSTPAWLMDRVMTKGDIEGGFASRCMMVVHKGKFKFSDKAGTLFQAEQREKLVKDLQQIASLQGNYYVTDAWRKARNAYNTLHDTRMGELERFDPLMASVLARKTSTFLLKLSMVIAASQSNSMKVDEEHCHQAWDLLTDLEENIPYAFKNYGEAVDVKHTMDIKRFLLDMNVKQIEYRYLAAMYERQYSAKKVREGMTDLCKTGFLEPAFDLGAGWYRVIGGPQGHQNQKPEL